jgi:hypothetical protein
MQSLLRYPYGAHTVTSRIKFLWLNLLRVLAYENELGQKPRRNRLVTLLFLAMLYFSYPKSAAAQNLNVTNFGARGDAVQFLASTTSNSTAITMRGPTGLSASDVGKVILLFGAGRATTPTNNEDIVGTIKSVLNGTNIGISVPAGATTSSVSGVFGTQNAQAFQACVDASQGATVVSVPAGKYLLITPQSLDPSFIMQNTYETHPAVTIQKGGIHFLGADRDSTVLMGCGAWQNKGPFAYRGFMFALQGPVTNDAPIKFESLTFDGGVPVGLTSYNGFPARTTDGDGWDATHDAVLDVGLPPLHAYKSFKNCRFIRWRGEILKSVTSMTDGFIQVTDCIFSDGNASAFNFNFTHDINSCTFSNLFQVTEFYEAYNSNACSMEYCLITNITGNAIAINGARVANNPTYTFTSNTIACAGVGIMTMPGQNVYILGNKFYDNSIGVGIGPAGYQGTGINSNVVVAGNTFTNCYYAFQVMGAGDNRLDSAAVYNNILHGGGSFAYGYGWGTNVIFTNNLTIATQRGLDSTLLEGQWFPDHPTNQFPPHDNWDYAGGTNAITYAFGMRHTISVSQPGTIWALDDMHPSQMPPSASIGISNLSSQPLTVFLSKSAYPGGGSAVIPAGSSIVARWSAAAWHPAGQASPPQDFHIIGQ